MLSAVVQGVSRVRRRLDAIQAAADAEVWKEIEAGARLLEVSARRRAIVARGTNVQDAARRERLSGRTPIRVKAVRRSLAALIYVVPFWTNARSAAIRNLYQKHGISERLLRRFLWVDMRRGGTNAAVLRLGKNKALREAGRSGARARRRTQHDTRAGLTRMRLEGKLLAWAQGRSRAGDVGEQHRASVVRPPAEVRLDLVLGPAAHQHEASIVQRIRAAVKRAVKE